MTKKKQDEKPDETVDNPATTPMRTFFLPFEGRTIEAEDLADVDAKLNKEKESEVGDGGN
jgi:hypothetical protein